MTSIGIDLGTSNSLVSYWDTEKRKAILIKNKHDKSLTPSVVNIGDKQTIIVGEDARELLSSDPENTIQYFKRFMGTNKTWKINNQEYTAIDFSSLILSQLKEDAENFLDEKISQVIISVPAYFNNDQRQATISAGQMAGFDNINLVSEPTAAAIAYGIDRKEENYFLICDLGGGTYDVSLLECFAGTLNVLAIFGDNRLGGLDFTNVLVDDFLENEGRQLSVDDSEKVKLQQIMNKAKENLNSDSGIEITIEWDQNYTYERSAKQLDALWEDLYERLRMPILRTLSDASLSLEKLNQIILVGGSTKLKPIVYQFGKLFGRPPYTGVNPDEIVGIGAGIRSGMDTDVDLIDEMVLTDVAPFSMGVGIADKNRIDNKLIYSPIIERNTPLPASKVNTYVPISPKQKFIEFKIYQGERMMVSENLQIGQMKIPVSKNSTNFDVRFTYDNNGVLEVEVTDNETQSTKKVLINNSRSHLTGEEMEEHMKKLANLKIHPRDKKENQQIIKQLNELFEVNAGEKRELIKQMYDDFLEVLNSQDELEINRLRAGIEVMLDQFKL